jgi:uncharacterized protein YkwD
MDSLVGSALVLGIALACVTGCSGEVDGTPGASEANPLDGEESALVASLNQLRSDSGAPTLTVCASLNVSASRHADDMRDRNYLDDESPDGSMPRDRGCDAGYGPACGTSAGMAELVASGLALGDQALGQWTEEEDTNALMMDPGLLVVGIGRALGVNEEQEPVWAMDLASMDDPSCAE